MTLSNSTVITILDIVDARNIVEAIEHKLEVCNEVQRFANPKYMTPKRYEAIGNELFRLSDQLSIAQSNLETLEKDFVNEIDCADILRSAGVPFQENKK